MNDILIGKIARTVKTVSVEESIGRTLDTLKTAGLSELPVTSMGRIVGMISEQSILGALTSGDPKEISARPIANLVSRDILPSDPRMTVHQAAELLKNHNKQLTVVIDEYGNYRGVVSVSDLSSALTGTSKPPSIGGMATPLGVYLTCGSHRAGASDLGLVLSGATLGLMMYSAVWAVYGIAYLIDKFKIIKPWSIWAILASPSISITNWMDILKFAILALSIPIFLLMLRLAPMAGYHAAEHQTVHAIEMGEPLKPENVCMLPRVHPRCGTNIMAAVGLFLLVRQVLPEELAILAAIFLILFARQAAGGFLQQYGTTRPASRKQLENGIAAGEKLLEKYRENPACQLKMWQRIWNTGLPQTLIGWGIVTQLTEMLRILPPSFLLMKF